MTPFAETAHRVYASPIASDAFQGQDALLNLIVSLPDPGIYALGTDNNANASECTQCVLVRVDEGSGQDRVFFADGGVLKIKATSAPLDGTIDASLTDAHFVEVTISEDPPFASTPVDGGNCLEGVSTVINVVPGGESGAGGEGGAPEVPEGCTEVSEGDWFDGIYTNGARYVTPITPNLYTAQVDGIILDIYNNDVGTFRVGHGIDETYLGCERCLLANLPEKGDGDGLWFYAIEGQLEIASNSVPLSGVLDATLTDVTFVQVDPDANYTPIEGGGECLHLATATISKP